MKWMMMRMMVVTVCVMLHGDVVWWCRYVILCVMLCCHVMLSMILCMMLCWDVVRLCCEVMLWCCVWWCGWWWMLWYDEMNDFKLLEGFGNWWTDGRTNERTNGRTDIGGCRVAFATEKEKEKVKLLRLWTLCWCKVWFLFSLCSQIMHVQACSSQESGSVVHSEGPQGVGWVIGQINHCSPSILSEFLSSLAPAPLCSNFQFQLSKTQFRNKRSRADAIMQIHPFPSWCQ